LSAPWGLVFLVGFRFAGGGYRFRSVCLGDSMAGRRGFGAALLLSLDGGGASFSFLWCSTGIVRHLPTSGAPRQSCSGGLSGARRLLGRRRLEFTVATAGGPWHFAAAKRDTAREPNSSRSPLVDTADGLTQRVHLAHQRPGPSGTVVFFPSTPLRSFHCSSSTKKHYKRKTSRAKPSTSWSLSRSRSRKRESGRRTQSSPLPKKLLTPLTCKAIPEA